MASKLLESYYAFCVVFVTIVPIMLIGIFLVGFVQGIIKAIRRNRQGRESRRYLKQVIGHMDEVRPFEPGKWRPYYKLMVHPENLEIELYGTHPEPERCPLKCPMGEHDEGDVASQCKFPASPGHTVHGTVDGQCTWTTSSRREYSLDGRA